uniref:Uncharacterized protein n=1 Tax=Anguilla anguilla TaxID=7936 RepID=A0A0E9RSX7_ANGAN
MICSLLSNCLMSLVWRLPNFSVWFSLDNQSPSQAAIQRTCDNFLFFHYWNCMA